MSSLPKYANSTPKSIQVSTPALINKDFALFVEQYKPQTSVNIEEIREENVAFYKEVMTTLFHTVFVAKTAHTEDGYGSGNIQLIKLNRDGGTYRLELYGVRQARIVYPINDAKVEFTGTTMKINSNIGLSLTVNKSGDVHGDTKTDLWQLTLYSNGALACRYHAVALHM